MRGEGFAEENGGRPIAKRIGVIIIDEADPDAAAELDEATKARLVNGVELFVVGVGKRLSPERLRRLATEPAEQHVFHVADYDDLASIVGRVSTAICPGRLARAYALLLQRAADGVDGRADVETAESL